MGHENMKAGQNYEIWIDGHLDLNRVSGFGGLCLTHMPDGHTLISGQITDQAALYGILIRIRDMGIPLVSIRRTEKKNADIW